MGEWRGESTCEVLLFLATDTSYFCGTLANLI